MNTKLTLLAALLFAGASQAALAQDHADHGDRPQASDHPAAAPSAPPHSAPMAPQGGHARFGAPPPPGAAPAPAAAVPAPGAGPRGGDRHWDGERQAGGDRHFDRGTGPNGVAPSVAPSAPVQGVGADRRWSHRGDAGTGPNGFAPGATANGDHRWDRHDAPREVVPPTPGGHVWDRQHDDHNGDPRRVERDARNWDHRDGDRRDGGHGDWNGDHRDGDHRDGDHRAPPANWRHWERGRTPPSYFAPHRYRVGSYRAPYGYFVRNWAYGDFLPSGWFDQSYWIDDFYDYDLPWPPPGFHWVRVGADVLLVDDYSGQIVQVIRDMFW